MRIDCQNICRKVLGRISLATVFSLFLWSCNTTEERYRVPLHRHIAPLNIIRYDQDFFDDGNIDDSVFLQLYTEHIMKMGNPSDSQTKEFLELFRNDSDMQQVYKDCQQTFANTKALEQSLGEAFYRLGYFIPDMPIPEVSMHISGFGQSIVSAPHILSAGIDKFLGKDYPLYGSLFYPYQTVRMCPDRLLYDYLNGWIRSEFTTESLLDHHRLLDFLLYEGKIFFLMQHVFPNTPPEWIAGFSEEQQRWCEENEEKMWLRILEYEHLYSQDPLVLSKYLGDAPHTIYFTEESPARAAIWIGLQIIEAYMALHKEVTIIDLMMTTNADSLYSDSLYRP